MAVDVRGNPICWHDVYNFDLCCSSSYGSEGNSDCWDEVFTYKSCCLAGWRKPELAQVGKAIHSYFSEQGEDHAKTILSTAALGSTAHGKAGGFGFSEQASCWEQAREMVQRSSDPISQHPALGAEVHLRRFCCYPTDYSSAVCWGSDRLPHGSPIVTDSMTGAPLNFTRRYTECCFPHLWEHLHEEPAEWIMEQFEHDFVRWRGPYRTEDFDAFEADVNRQGLAAWICRFKIRKSGISHCDFERPRMYIALVQNLLNALQVLYLLTDLPELDFFLYLDEAYGVRSRIGDVGGAWLNLTSAAVPVLVQAQLERGAGVLLPWWAYLQQGWTRLYSDRVQRESQRTPWAERKPVLFWRGSDTGCLLPGSCDAQPGECFCSEWSNQTWASFPRSRLVLATTFMPTRIDAKYTMNVVHADCAKIFDASGLWIDELIPPEAHVQYKYLIYVDGISLSDRLFWMMLTGSLVFKVDSQLRVWLDKGLKPWVHYVPVAENMTDLVDRLDWARQNDAQAAEIANAGTRFAAEHFALEGNMHYLYRLLWRLADAYAGRAPTSRTLSRSSPSQPRSLTSMAPPAVPKEPDFAESLDCWALESGYTPEFCCNTDFFGDGGNIACWDGPYTFESCCVGKLAERSFWIEYDQMLLKRAADAK